MSKPIDPTQIANLLAADDKVQQAKRASQIRRRVFPTEPRSYEVWFVQQTHFGPCTNKDCVDPRDNVRGKTMVAEINGSDICRYCFLEGVNRVSA